MDMAGVEDVDAPLRGGAERVGEGLGLVIGEYAFAGGDWDRVEDAYHGHDQCREQDNPVNVFEARKKKQRNQGGLEILIRQTNDGGKRINRCASERREREGEEWGELTSIPARQKLSSIWLL